MTGRRTGRRDPRQHRHLNALRPRGDRPRGRSLGHACWSPARGSMGCPGGRRVGRTPPTDLSRNANHAGGVTGGQANTPAPGGPEGRGVRSRAGAPRGTTPPNHRPTKERQPRWRRYGRTRKHSGSEGRRAGVRALSVRVETRSTGEERSGAYRRYRLQTETPANRATAPEPSSPRLRGRGRDQAVGAARSQGEGQPGWLNDIPPTSTGKPKHAPPLPAMHAGERPRPW
jgi:hypothetical protein